MYIIQRNNILFIFTLFLSLFSVSAVHAQASKKETVKEFLKDSEFSLQRRLVKEGAMGKKGLLAPESKKADISNLINVDLIDPFQNKTIKGTQTDLEPLDDGIELALEEEKFSEDLATFRMKIEDYFAKIENQENIDPVKIVNSLKISRIVSSPIKYVEIYKKKYSEKDMLKVRVNLYTEQIEFENMLNEVSVATSNSEEAEILEELKQEAIDRFSSLTESPDTALNIIDVEIAEIAKASVSFVIDGNTYKVVMKR